MANAPSVSVVIPTAARWHFLIEAVRTCLRQRDVEVEVIAVSNGPEPGPMPDEAEFADPRVTVMRFPEWRGLCRARNIGLANAKGEWVAFLDDDDRWSPDKLERQITAAVAAGSDYAYASAAVVDERLGMLWSEEAPDPQILRERILTTARIPAIASNVVVRTDVAREISGFDELLAHYADWDFEIRLATRGLGARVPEPLVAYVQHGNNMHVRSLAGIEEEQRYLLEKHAAEGRSVGSVYMYRWLAGGYRRAGHRRRAARTYLRAAWRHTSAPDLVRAVAVLLNEDAMVRFAQRRGHRVAGPEPPWLARDR